MRLSALYCGNFECITPLKIILEKVFVSNIVNIRNAFFLGSGRGMNRRAEQTKSPENRGEAQNNRIVLELLRGSRDLFFPRSDSLREAHFVGVHGPYELHRKVKQIECTACRCSRAIWIASERKANWMHRVSGASMQFIWPVNIDKMRFNTYIYIFLQQSLSRNCLL